MKVAIVGAGIFGLLTAKNFKDYLNKKIQITIFEYHQSILKGASANNLNRIHLVIIILDLKTAYQSKLNYYKFIEMFKDCIREDIKSYYFIAKNSITNFENYNFCKKIKIPFKEVRLNDLDFKISNVEGGIVTNEAVYDIDKIR